MNYTKKDLEKIHGVSLRRVVEELGMTLDRHDMCRCVVHEERTASMKFNFKGKYWHCFGCGESGGAVKLVMAFCKWNREQAMEWIVEKFGIVVEEKEWIRRARSGRKKRRKCPLVEYESGAEIKGLPYEYLKVKRSNENSFCRALVGAGILTEEQMVRAAERYKLGSSWDGRVIFWQVDAQGRLRDGKIMSYGADCHRDKRVNPTWVTYLLRQKGMFEGESVKCLFGENLTLWEPGKRVAVVESEKTAVICSELMPEFVWVATGGMGNLNGLMVNGLMVNGLMDIDRVILVPDTDVNGEAYGRWKEVGDRLGVETVDWLEVGATDEQKIRKIDIADWLIEGGGEK